MRSFVLLCLAVGFAAAQTSQSIGTYGYDLNGRRVDFGTMGVTASDGASATVQTMRNVNGRQVPAESIEEKVVSDGPDGKVVERIVKRYDDSGRVASSEKQLVEAKNGPDGSTTLSTSVYRSDINGRLALNERAVTRSQKSGDTTVADTLIERPTINGSFDLVEKQSSVSRGNDKLQNVETTVLRKDSSGSMREAGRQVVLTKIENGTVTQQVDDYNTAITGKMELAVQKIATTVKNADGSETVVVDVFGGAATGRTMNGSASGPQLRERQIVERKPGAGGSLTETFSIQRAGLEDGKLGAPRKISERICNGDCLPKDKKP